jgi:hypothetical protein
MPRRVAAEPGCRKPLLVGCGLALLLVLGGSILFLTRQSDLLRWTLEAMQPEVVRRLPPELPAAERARLDAAFAAAARRAESGQFDLGALQRLQRQFMTLAPKQRLSREEVAEFLAALEAFAAAGSGQAP